MRSLPLDDLPKHSPWAAFLLDLRAEPPEEPEAYTTPETYASMYRAILDGYRSDPVPTPEFVRSVRARGRSEPDMISIDEELFRSRTRELLERERTVVREALEPVRDEAETVVDLGCGWGSTLGILAEAVPGAAVIGGEFVESGVQVARALYADRDRIVAERFDFHSDWELVADLGADTVVFTKASMTTVGDVDGVIDTLGALAADGTVIAGVHLEPVDIHPETVLGALRRNYARVRGYNGEMLRSLEADERVEIAEVSYDVVGANPLHPVSVVRWWAV